MPLCVGAPGARRTAGLILAGVLLAAVLAAMILEGPLLAELAVVLALAGCCDRRAHGVHGARGAPRSSAP